VGDSPVPRLPVTGGASARSCPAERWRRLRPAGSKIGAADPEDPVHGRMSGCRRPAKVASCWRRARFSRTRHVWSAWPRGASAGEPRGVESSSRGGPRPWGESSIVPVRLDLWRETGDGPLLASSHPGCWHRSEVRQLHNLVEANLTYPSVLGTARSGFSSTTRASMAAGPASAEDRASCEYRHRRRDCHIGGAPQVLELGTPPASCAAGAP